MSERLNEAQSAARRTWRWRAFFVGVGVLIYLCWTQMLYPSYSARYKLTVEVETPTGIKTGASVVEAVYGWEPTLFGLISGVRNRVYGEAVFVDLGDNKNLVVTLTTNGSGKGLYASGRSSAVNAKYLPAAIFEFPTHDRTLTPQGIRDARAKGARAISPEKLPTTVTFSDLSVPLSVKRVDPRNISAVFGDGYHLKNAWIQITSSPLTRGIEKRLGWLPRYYDKKLDGLDIQTIRSANRMANSLGSGSFKIK